MRFWGRRRADDGWLTIRHTAAGVPRATLFDAVLDDGTLVLVKDVTGLRLTYQIRLATFRAVDQGVRLELHVPRGCWLSDDLRELIDDYEHVVSVVEHD